METDKKRKSAPNQATLRYPLQPPENIMIYRRLPMLLMTLLALSLGTACQPTPQPPAAPTSPAQAAAWDDFVNNYIEAYFDAHPAHAVVLGRHEFAGQLPDWSRAGIQKEVERLKKARADALAFPVDSLTPEQQFQREYFVAVLDRSLFWTDKAKAPFHNPAFYFDWQSDGLDPAVYITLEYAPTEQRMQAFTKYLKAIPNAAAQIRDNLEMPMARSVLDYGIASFGGMAEYFANDVPQVWSSVQDPALQAEFAAANAVAAKAMAELTDWLKSNQATATEDYALGADLFSQMIYDSERVDIPLAELEAIGRADLARNQKALAEACAAFAPGKSIPECYAKMASRKPEGGAVATARRQLDELKTFVVEHDIVSIPGTEDALVEESPPYARSNSAYINTAGPYETNMPSIYFISPPDPSWPQEVQDAYVPGESDLLFTSVHEVWPGHFLNFVHAGRAKWIFGRIFVTYAFGEGWAHYTEEMMYDDGLRDRSPETHIGQLSNALLRNVRFLSAIGLHTRGMSVEQSKRMFMEEGYQDEGTAIQQANRGTYDPAYLNYTMGKLMIRQLRDDWIASRGGRKAWREFHDTFLSYGGPPIPLVRAQMMGGKAEAKFYRAD
jgi:uncharacterized protein (DUF885 family)